MIKPEELRPGNTISFYDVENDYWSCVRVGDEIPLSIMWKCPELFRPVHLNSFILEGMSFEKSDDGVFSRGNVSVKLINGIYMLEDKYGSTKEYTVPVTTLHRLQNLYANRNNGEMIDLPT